MINGLKNIFRSYFLTGLLVLGPLAISYYVVRLIMDAADNALVTNKWLPDIPGVGLAIAIVIILIAGFLGKNVIGKYIFISAGDILGRVPVVGSIYSSTKQIFETLFGGQNRHFGRVVLIQYPHAESWTLAFVTSEEPPPEIKQLFSQSVISVYVPTTPNPTSGFYMYVPLAKAQATTLTVDQAFKIIVSFGLVHLPHHSGSDSAHSGPASTPAPSP